MADKQRDVMMVVSQLKFGKYLREPAYAAAAAHLPNPITCDKSKVSQVDLMFVSSYKQGEFDILMIHRHHGILVGEVKSIGLNPENMDTPAKEAKAIVNRIDKAVDQLNKARKVLEHLVSDVAKLQVNLINSGESTPRVFLAGPPGTGKTVVLVLVGGRWFIAGHDVHLLASWEKAHAAVILIEEQLNRLLHKSGHSPKIYPHFFDFADPDKGMDNVRDAVETLKKAAVNGELYVIADEAGPDDRCPPAVVKEVEKAPEFKKGRVHAYTAHPVHAPTDGPDVCHLEHVQNDKGHADQLFPKDCEHCGEKIAKVLKDLDVREAVDSRNRVGTEYPWDDIPDADEGVLKLLTILSQGPQHFHVTNITIDEDPNMSWEGESCTLSGWGRLSGTGSSANILKKVTMKKISNTECASRVTAAVRCVRCKGVLTGVTSWGVSTCSGSFPSVYTRLSNYASWMRQNSW
nr:hypothetical protein BaRGS_019197 [Batillaria attramentaria]